MRRFVTVAVIIVALVVVGFVGVRVLGARHTAAAPQYAYATAAYGNLFVNVTGNGTVQAATSLNVQASQNGTITSVPVHLGQSVKKGQVLATVDDSGTLETQVLSAKAQLASDQASLNSLENPTPPTAAQISSAKEKVQADNQRVATDEQEIQALNVTAPFGGVVAQMGVSTGQTVGQNTTLVQIVNPSDVEVDANFPAINLNNVFIGEGATITAPGFGTMDATVSSIGVMSSGQGRGGVLYPVTLTVQSPLTGLRQGMSVTASIPDAYTYSQGTIQFSQAQDVTAQSSGTVASIAVNVGQTVSQGQKLLTLSDPSLQTQLASDEAALSNDENTLNQLENPTPPSASQISSLKTKIQVDEHNVTSAEQAVAELNITSPITGIVTAVNAQVGDNTKSASSSSSSSSASVSSALFAVENPNTLQVLVPIDELSIAQVKAGQKAVITANALPGQTFAGTVAEIAPAGVNSQGVANFDVLISIQKPGKLLAGMSASVSILVAQVQHALLIPVEAVSGSGSHAFVRVRTSSGITGKQITIGLSNDVSAQVVSGLKAGDVVVTASVSSSSSTQSGGFGGGGIGRRLSGGGGGGNFRGGGGSSGRGGN